MSGFKIFVPGSSRPSELNLSSKQSTQVVPLNPTSHDDQPPTPEHPPPSPTTAMFGIQQKINPNPKEQVVAMLMHLKSGGHQLFVRLSASLETAVVDKPVNPLQP